MFIKLSFRGKKSIEKKTNLKIILEIIKFSF
jgi:hypothetical protein